MRYFGTLLCLLLLSCGGVFAQRSDVSFSDSTEQEFFQFWEDHKTLKTDILGSLLVAEGMSNVVALKDKWLPALEKQTLELISRDSSPRKKAEQLYELLHERVLKKYSASARAVSLMESGEFNCVTSAALYSHLAKVVGLDLMFHATPFHVSPVVEVDGKKIWIELTDPEDGFDIDLNPEETVEWLVKNKFVLSEELEGKGPDRVFNDFIGGHYRNSQTSLLGYHYYNHALALNESGKPEETFWALTKACIFEPEDQQIRQVYDLSFVSMSSKAKTLSSYHKITRAYFTTRGIDTSSVTEVLAAITVAIDNLIPRDPSFDEADSILSLLDAHVPSRHKSSDQLRELTRLISVNKAIDLSRRGKHELSFEIVSLELTRDLHNTKLQDIYVDLGAAYARNLLTTGHGSQAISLLDSMRTSLPDYARLREIYVATIITNVMISGQYRANPMDAREALLKAFEVDSTNAYLREAIASVYHELAMAQVRKNDSRRAKKLISEGLRYAPNHSFLKSDLDLVNKEMSKPKR